MNFFEYIREAFFGPRLSRSSKPGDQLTKWERHFIKSHMGLCPDCERGELCSGPEAGVSVNAKCNNCGSKFNLVMGGGELLFAERI